MSSTFQPHEQIAQHCADFVLVKYIGRCETGHWGACFGRVENAIKCGRPGGRSQLQLFALLCQRVGAISDGVGVIRIELQDLVEIFDCQIV